MNVFLFACDAAVRSALAEALQRRGHAVLAVAEPEAADPLRQVGDYPWVVLDITPLSEVGLKLCRQWRSQYRGRPRLILAVTSLNDPTVGQQALDAGADDVLVREEIDQGSLLELRLAVAERSLPRCGSIRRVHDAAGNVVELQGIVHDITRRKQIEEAILREQRALRQMLDLQERDRQVLAYELHDGFAQQLSGAMLYLQGFRETLPRRPDEAWRLFDLAISTLQRSIEETRRLINGLRPMVLDESGVVEAIGVLVGEARKEAGLDIEYIHNFDGSRLASQLENTLFRVVQESLTNVRRHSHSERAAVKLLRQNDRIYLEVRDWGVGFDPSRVERNHFGLEGIVERARLLGGQAQIQSEVGKGTLVTVDLPWVERLWRNVEERAPG
jgi:signal transduction histidine kinase